MFLNYYLSYIFCDSLDSINNQTYTFLDRISRSSDFSKIKMNIYNTCPFKSEKCTKDACEVHKQTYKNQNDIIDLLKTRESFSSNITNGTYIWNSIASLSDDLIFHKLISGLRFSVFTHIAAFNKRFLNYYLPNHSFYHQKYNPTHFANFQELYHLIRNAIGYLKYVDNLDLPASVLKLSKMINIDKYSLTVPDMKISELIELTIDRISCLDCEKCVLWGTIQAKGLMAAIEVLNNVPITQKKLVFLINFFRRLSETAKQQKKLLETPQFFLFLENNLRKLLISFVLCLLTTFILLRRNINLRNTEHNK